MNKCYLDMSLSRLVMVKLSKDILRRPEMKEYLDDYRKIVSFKIFTLPAPIRRMIDEQNLPKPFKDELKLAILAMGYRLCKFYNKVRESRNDVNFADYVDHIYWTHLGTIDNTRSIKSMYYAKLLRMTRHTWLFLCEYCVKGCIIDFWKKIRKSKHGPLKKKIAGLDQCYTFSSYWRYRVKDNRAELEVDIYMSDEPDTMDEYMFCSALFGGLETLKFYWNRLGPNRRKYIMNQFIKREGIYKKFRKHWKYDLDTYMFIIQLLKIYYDQSIIDQFKELPSLMPDLEHWPCSQIMPSVIEEAYHHADYDTKNQIMYKIFSMMCQERANIGDDSSSRKWFRHFWNDYKHIMDNTHRPVVELPAINWPWSYDPPEKSLMEDILLSADIETIEYMIMNEETWEEKEKMFNLIVNYTKMNIHSEKHKLFFRDLINHILPGLPVRIMYNSPEGIAIENFQHIAYISTEKILQGLNK